jgi:hypothetical protein
MSAENKALVRNFFEGQDREKRTPPELCSPDFTAHMLGDPPIDFASTRTSFALPDHLSASA